jgi:hypothetical protein
MEAMVEKEKEDLKEYCRRMGWAAWRDDNSLHYALRELRSIQADPASQVLDFPEGRTQHVGETCQPSDTSENVETVPTTEQELTVATVRLDEATSNSSTVKSSEFVDDRGRSIVNEVLMDEIPASERDEIVNRVLENPFVMCRLLQHDSTQRDSEYLSRAGVYSQIYER